MLLRLVESTANSGPSISNDLKQYIHITGYLAKIKERKNAIHPPNPTNPQLNHQINS